jgi:hypothetical protein
MKCPRPHPEERRIRRVSKDGSKHSWFETAQERLLTMRKKSDQAGVAFSAVAAEA